MLHLRVVPAPARDRRGRLYVLASAGAMLRGYDRGCLEVRSSDVVYLVLVPELKVSSLFSAARFAPSVFSSCVSRD